MDTSTLAVAIAYTNKVADQVRLEGFTVQVEEDRSILEEAGEEKIFYFLPKTSSNPQDGYDEYVYAENNWEQVGVTNVDLSGKEDNSNKVTTISNQSTDDEYPSAKCVYDLIGDVESALDALL